MELKRVLSLDEFKTLATIKERFKNFVAAGLKKQGKSTHPMNVVDVPGVQTAEEVIYKTKDKL